MYLTERSLAPLPPAQPRLVRNAPRQPGDPRRRRRTGVGSNVVFLGLTSLVTDVASEMVRVVLPLYLTVSLGLTPLQFGAFDGMIQLVTAVTAVTAVAGALVADRWRRYKEVAGAGYAVSAACKLGWLSVTAWGPAAAWLAVDRTGKGLRTAPRDALISLSAPFERTGEAFGLHRALDTMGALLGPVVAFWLLTLAPGSYDAVFVASFCAAVMGLALLVLFVRNRVPAGSLASTGPTARAVARQLLGQARFRRVIVAATAVSLFTISDAFIFLTYRRASGLGQAGSRCCSWAAPSCTWWQPCPRAGWPTASARRACSSAASSAWSSCTASFSHRG